MRLREFESDYGTGSTANIATMLNFLKKQSSKKGVDGQISMGALKNLMNMSKFGGADIHSYLDNLQAKGLITDYDENNIYFSDDSNDKIASDEPLTDLPTDDPMGAPMGAQPREVPAPMDSNLGATTDPMAMDPNMGTPMGAPATTPAPAANPMMQDPGMTGMGATPDPVPNMAKRALSRRK